MPQPRTTPDVEAFLDHLAEAGHAIGPRERLLAHRLLRDLAVRNELPDAPAACLKLLEPLLSRNAVEQARFAGLIQEFLAIPRSSSPSRDLFNNLLRLESPEARQIWTVAIAAVLTLIALVVLSRHQPAPTPVVQPPVVENPEERVEAPLQSPYVPAGRFEAAAAGDFPPGAEESNRLLWLRWTLGAIAGLLAGGVIVIVVRRLILLVYLQSVRTGDALERRILYDRTAVPNVIGDARIRAISRLLRQRIAGSRQVLDPAETLRATIRAGGALTARYRALRQTTEYLVLVDRRSGNDHQAGLQEFLFQALQQSGVHVDLFTFERSPGHGCRRTAVSGEGLDAAQIGEAAAPLDLAQLSNRYGGHRLLVFGDASAAFDPISGVPAPWTEHIGGFAQRAWLSPLPIASWSEAESGLQAMGFLVMPAWPTAIEVAAEWLSSDRVTLRPEEDWPRVYPAMLRGEAHAWVARQARPPADAEQRLLFELRYYLQAERFQWLCACAAFPVLSWPLTTAFGQEVFGARGDDGKAGEVSGEISLGFAALSALPWFRHGTMPRWLRESLLDRLDPAQERRIRGLLRQRLGTALTEGQGTPLTEVAMRRRIKNWFRRRPDRLSQDVILAGFLEPGVTSKLAQRLPDALRRMLFKDGRPIYGLRDAVLMSAMVTAAGLALLIGPGDWERFVDAWFPPATVASPQPVFELRGHQGGVNRASFSADGRWIVTASDDGTARIWRADGLSQPVVLGHAGPVTQATFSPDGRTVLTVSGAIAWLWDVDGPEPSRRRISTGATVRTAVSSPDGGFVAITDDRNALEIWLNDSSSGRWRKYGVTSTVAISPDGRLFLTAAPDGIVRVLDARTGRVLRTLAGHTRAVNSAAFSQDGQRVITGSQDGTARIWSVKTGEGTIVAGSTGRQPMTHVAFSPDGRVIVAVDGDGNVVVSHPSTSVLAVFAGDSARTRVEASVAPNSDQLMIATSDAVSVWDLISQKLEITLTIPGGLRSAAFSPDGQQIVTASGDGIVRLWGKPTTSVAIATCGTPESDTNARALARDLIGPISSALGHRFSPTVYPPSHWHEGRLGPAPALGVVRIRSQTPAKRDAALRLAASLESYRRLAAGRWVPTTVNSSSADISMGTCTPQDVTVSPPANTQKPATPPVTPVPPSTGDASACRTRFNPAEAVVGPLRVLDGKLRFSVYISPNVSSQQQSAMRLALTMWNDYSEVSGFVFEERLLRNADIRFQARPRESVQTTACVAYDSAGSFVWYAPELMRWVSDRNIRAAARIYAHELGHALGLDRRTEPGHIMSHPDEDGRTCQDLATNLLTDITLKDAVDARTCVQAVRAQTARER